MLCLELTSLHVQPATGTARSGRPTPEDLEQMVSHALFSDAAAAVVLEPGAGVGARATTSSTSSRAPTSRRPTT